MDILIQNKGAAPIFFQMNKMEEGKPVPLPRVIFEPDNQITKVSAEIYEKMLESPFYKTKFEQGTLIPLNGNSALDNGITESIQSTELLYAKYVSLVSRIKATTGTEADQLRPYLDAEGMPSFDLCKKNLGNGFEIGNLNQFRARYIIEEANGMHGNTLILPNGGSVQAGGENVHTVVEDAPAENEGAEDAGTTDAPAEKNLEEMTLEELKAVADEKGVTYDEAITFNRLLKRIQKADQQ